MSYESIVINANPVNAYETYHEELLHGQFDIQSVISRDMGGFWSAKFKVNNPSRNQARNWLAAAVGRDVKIINDKSNIVWEGYISKVSVSTGRASAFNDLEQMANEVWVRYTDLTTGTLSRSTHQTDAQSQARWGRKDFVLSGGQLSSSEADQKADVYLAYNYWARPQLDTVRVGGSVSGETEIGLDVQCLGYWHTLKWRVYNQTVATGTDSASAVVEDIILDVGDFINSYVIDSNGTPVTVEYDADRRAEAIIAAIAELGDQNNNVWIAGVTRNRQFYFKQAVPTIEPEVV